MIQGKSVLAVIPARIGSKGLTGKNLRSFAGKPLFLWSMEMAKRCPYVDEIVLSTDSNRVIELANEAGFAVPFLRPAHLASDHAKSADVVLHAMDQLLTLTGKTFDIILLLEPTSPLRTDQMLSSALETFTKSETASSLVTITRVETQHPNFLFHKDDRNFLQRYQPKDELNIRRQDLDDLYFLNGLIYMSYSNNFRQCHSFFTQSTLGLVIAKEYSVEIDDFSDFVVAEFLMNRMVND